MHDSHTPQQALISIQPASFSESIFGLREHSTNDFQKYNIEDERSVNYAKNPQKGKFARNDSKL